MAREFTKQRRRLSIFGRKAESLAAARLEPRPAGTVVSLNRAQGHRDQERVMDAARWLAAPGSDLKRPLIPFVRGRFGLTILETIDALKLAHVMKYGR